MIYQDEKVNQIIEDLKNQQIKAVLISIQPHWVFLIIARLMGWDIPQEKTIEVRKDFPKDPTWNKRVQIYCSRNRKSFKRIPTEYQPLMSKFLGKVIGEFVCDRIEEFHEWQLQPSGKFQEAEQVDLDLFLKNSCLSFNEVCAYRENLPYYKPLYGWHISDLKIYDKPRELGEFWKVGKCPYNSNDSCTYKYHCFRAGELNRCGEQITRPPQSWQYCEV